MRRLRLWLWLKVNKFLIPILTATLLSGCVTIYNPATQKEETLFIDTENEVALGRDMDVEMHKKLKILTIPEVLDRLNYIGAKVAVVSDRRDLAYQFRVVKDKEVNAFSIPGGFIYVNTGLLYSANDDELASVLAHEIAHVAARHGVKRLQAVLGYQVIMGIALGLTGKRSMAKAMDIIFNLATLGYSRQDEFLADRLAVKYATRGGFSPYGMVTFLEKLKKEAENNGSFNPVFLSSHPSIDERIKNVENEIADLPSVSGSLP